MGCSEQSDFLKTLLKDACHINTPNQKLAKQWPMIISVGHVFIK